ncbi:MAG: YcnI family copper-binding membrane protein [Actinomycetales bacterium]
MSISRNARRRRRSARPLSGLIGLTVALVLGVAASASAHVHVHPDSTSAGGYAQLAFRVPSESESANTVTVEVHLPTDTPFTSVSVKPKPGWKSEVTEAKLPKPVEVKGATITKAPVKVVWTATGAGLAPQQYDDFDLSVGPLPAAGTRVVLPVAQTYSDGSVVRWSQVAAQGATEPERPAPEFTTSSGTEPSAEAAASASQGQSWLAIVAILVAALALLTSVAALVSGRTNTGRGARP